MRSRLEEKLVACEARLAELLAVAARSSREERRRECSCRPLETGTRCTIYAEPRRLGAATGDPIDW